MSIESKLFWFVYWFLFVNFLGFVDVELFVITNFLIAFFVIFNIMLPYVSFEAPLLSLRNNIIENKNLNMFILEYLNMVLVNIKESMSKLFTLILNLYYLNKDFITLSRLLSIDNGLFKTLIIKNIKLKKLKKCKLYINLISLNLNKKVNLVQQNILLKVWSSKVNPC